MATIIQIPLDLKLDDVSRLYTLAILKLLNGNRTHAAERLGLSRRGLMMRIVRYKYEGHYVTPPLGKGRDV